MCVAPLRFALPVAPLRFAGQAEHPLGQDGALDLVAAAVDRVRAREEEEPLPAVQLVGGACDQAVVSAYEGDPLNYTGKVRARTGAEMIGSVDRVVAGLPRLTLPVLAMHGSADAVVPPAATDLIEAHVGSADVTTKRYDGLFHEIFNEPEKEQVLDDLVAWLDAHANRVAQFAGLVQRAKLAPTPNAAMLAQIAGQARVLLAR